MPSQILVIDDDQDIALSLQDRLTFLGFQVATARNGAEGLARLENMTADGILLDIQMPVMDGLTMLDHLREQSSRIPIIVMSADLNQNKIIEAMKRGASDYILKPIDLDILAEKCSVVFSKKQG